MKQLIKLSFLFVVLFLAIPAFADGDMGAGGKACSSNCGGRAATEISTNTKSETQENNAFENIFSWVYEQIFELID